MMMETLLLMLMKTLLVKYGEIYYLIFHEVEEANKPKKTNQKAAGRFLIAHFKR